ncbi:MAG: hypothetical protein GZ085_08650 [Sulfuriferula multivorans]|uniref:DUF5666 domain-containing protein n=1 Tax=Sulfuriferula multivorans TaxID=1559896 RepID=A0A7C9NT61_9PROT|nr:hypothetical protein [Sulfuriferula multivorans]
MKQFATIFLTAILTYSPAYAMKMVDAPDAKNSAMQSTPVQQNGKVDAIYAGASKIVIKGETYAYNPLTTVVTLNGKRVTISDVRMGDTVQFQATAQGANTPFLLATINIQRQ